MDREMNGRPTADAIERWLVSYLAGVLELEPDEVDVTVTFDRYGLDSFTAVGLAGDLEDWLGHAVDPALPYDYPTVQSLAQHLAQTED